MALPSSQPSAAEREPLSTMAMRKCREQPLVPLGALLTCSALVLAGKAIREHNSRLANRMFFWRVGFQAFTIAALLGGAAYYGEKVKTKSRDEKLTELSKEREKLWIEELERIEASAQKARAESERIKAALAESKSK